MDIKIELDDELRALATEAFERVAREHYAALPKPDPQYSSEQAAELLCCEVTTVRAWMKLPAHHPRHLPYVLVTDGPKGRRIRLSDITAWQQRNTLQAVTAAAEAQIISRRSARRRG